ncbi:MAG TPA: Gfo/Idh/MocA family oxidoreductase [Chloroflexota bacterium]|nr:Gfo/Idh/MocA family oxidoreductase [Chloroflexota bacterium]
MKPIKVGVVGCGTIATVMHLPGLVWMRDQGKVEIVAVTDAIAEKSKAASVAFGVPAHFSDLDRMLSETEFDLLVNLTPIPEHFAVSLAGLRAGRHVYTQKPMSATVDEATTLIDEAAKRGLRLACAPEHPVLPVIQTIETLVRGGAIGKVAFARVQSSHEGPEQHNVPRDSTWFYQAGSSPIVDMGVHGLSRITAILGPVRRIACFSGRSRDVRYHTVNEFKGKRIDVEIDDSSLMMLDFGAAQFAFLDATYCVEATLGPSLEIHGSEGTIAVIEKGFRLVDIRLFESSKHVWRDVEIPPRSPCRDLGVLHLVDSLREGLPLRLTGERGRHLLDVMTAATRSATEGRTIELTTEF